MGRGKQSLRISAFGSSQGLNKFSPLKIFIQTSSMAGVDYKSIYKGIYHHESTVNGTLTDQQSYVFSIRFCGDEIKGVRR